MFFNISKNIFNGEVQKLIIEENQKGHRGHFDQNVLDKKFTSRKEGCSELSKLLIQKLNLHLKKHTQRIEILKEFFVDEYEWHVPSNVSLTNYCYYWRKKEFIKNFDETLGSFQEIKKKYSFDN